jgi:hypothetical protein
MEEISRPPYDLNQLETIWPDIQAGSFHTTRASGTLRFGGTRSGSMPRCVPSSHLCDTKGRMNP